MTFVDQTQVSDLATPAMPVRRFASHPEVTMAVNLNPRPMTHWAVHHRGELSERFLPTIEASLRISTNPRAPTSLIVFLAALSRFRHCVQQVRSARALRMP